jgi:adenine-specific DNA-methyltransferase
MKTVFLGGSRRISKLTEVIRRELDQLMESGTAVVVGDANGADRALQQHFADRGYGKVVVYAVRGAPRNNVGGWSVRAVDAPKGARGFELYSLKDVQMACDACSGFMLWDGKSRGTVENIRRLLESGKPVAVYLSSARRILDLRSRDDLGALGLAPRGESAQQLGLGFDAPDGAGQSPTVSDEGSDSYRAQTGASGRGSPRVRRKS